MEKLDFDLKSKLKTYLFMDLDSVRRIVLQLIEALQCVHEAGYVHRDIKPDNIMFKKFEDDKDKFLLQLIDFGLVTSIKKASKLKEKVNAAGTLNYMSIACMEGSP